MVSDDEFVRVRDEILKLIVEGNKKLLFWGFTPFCINLISNLVNMGLDNCIVGIIDHKNNKQGCKVYNYVVLPPSEIKKLDIDTLVICYDEEKEDVLELFYNLYSKNRKVEIILYGNKNYEFSDSLFQEIIDSLPVKSKAGGYPFMLIHIYQSLIHVIKNNIPGDVVEIGTFQGGTTVFMAKVIKALGSDKKIFSFDTFSGYPESKNPLDLFKDKKCEFSDYDFVKNYCKPYKIELIRGNIVETINTLKGEKISFSFFDTDNYTPTKIALKYIFDLTPKGGIFAFDHYYSKDWIKTIGERIAIKKFFKDKNVFNLQGTGIFIKL
ncbi:TylF/MycF family methyltransferase [Dehalococcoidia bacterium]|nr:TylF/MycF family methyltransferase [Dehalococcoidia bacterium]MCL0104247.1 TylF/MycF family methyltransferase [Dehalococcoidia bacterium]